MNSFSTAGPGRWRASGRRGASTAEHGERRHRQILKLVGDDIDRGWRTWPGLAVVERRPGVRSRDRRGARRLVGGEDVAAITESAADMASMRPNGRRDDADGGARARRSFGQWATDAVWVSR